MKPKRVSKGIVLVKVHDPVNMTSDGIYIEEEWKTLPMTGEVIMVGEDVTFCKPGEKVFFERYSSVQTPFDEMIRACKESHILAVYETV